MSAGQRSLPDPRTPAAALLQQRLDERAGGLDVFVGHLVAGPGDVVQQFVDLGDPVPSNRRVGVADHEVLGQRLGLPQPAARRPLDRSLGGRREVFVEPLESVGVCHGPLLGRRGQKRGPKDT